MKLKDVAFYPQREIICMDAARVRKERNVVQKIQERKSLDRIPDRSVIGILAEFANQLYAPGYLFIQQVCLRNLSRCRDASFALSVPPLEEGEGRCKYRNTKGKNRCVTWAVPPTSRG
jgi:hypothetical protein